MDQLKLINNRVVSRLNTNLNGLKFDADTFVANAVEYDKMLKFYAFYGITGHHPIFFDFQQSNISGSYFLGKCHVGRSTIYKSDIRGDELKRKGDPIDCEKNVPLLDDEVITIRDSLLYKTLVHSHSHNPESPEEFSIKNTISAHHSNIHGSTLVGCFLGPFSTVDLINLHACIIGEFSYVQAKELFHQKIAPGTVWIQQSEFELTYRFDQELLSGYIGLDANQQPQGILYDFVEAREKEFERLFDVIALDPLDLPETSAVSRYAVLNGRNSIGENVLVAQRAYLENAVMGDGSNAQENSYVIDSLLEGMNVTAHGAKIIHSRIGLKTFVGFNAFLNGKPGADITIGRGSIVMPHTIIDALEPIEIPEYHLVWGLVRSAKDLETNSLAFSELEKIKGELSLGNMVFSGSGVAFVNANKARINQILLANGSFFQNEKNRGHAQDGQKISYNILQPYTSGENQGLYPSVRIDP